jgi:hypothetical protein
VLEPLRQLIYYGTLTFLIHEMLHAGAPLEQLVGFFDNLSLISALLLSCAFSALSLSSAAAAPASVLAWTAMVSLLQLFVTALFKFLLYVSINSELQHGSQHKEALRQALRIKVRYHQPQTQCMNLMEKNSYPARTPAT